MNPKTKCKKDPARSHVNRHSILSLAALSALIGFQAYAAPGDLDLSFQPSGLDGPVRGLALLPDGKMVVGGGFTQCYGFPYCGLVRLNGNGSLDQSFSES